MRKLYKNISALYTPQGCTARRGREQSEIKVHEKCAILCEDGKIARIFEDTQPLPENVEVFDCGGLVATPGLVDCHTHAVFAGWRQHELALKLQGASYLDILNAGGGIIDTVRKTRAASEDELKERSIKWLDEMKSYGVTAAEIKSGYGLDLENELKQLRVIRSLKNETKQTLKSTLLAAHAVPPEYSGRADDYIELVCNVITPAAAPLCDFCDVFCESSVFDKSQSRKVLEAGAKYGLRAKIHADEIKSIGGAQLAGELCAVSAEHLAVTDEEGCNALAKSRVIAVLLPATSFYLKKGYANARMMIENGVAVAIGSDFNPGSCPSLNLQLCINLGALYMGLTPNELLCAVTLNAACAIGEGESLGSVETGKRADFVLWNAEDWETVCYRFGSNLAKTVVIGGEPA